MAAFPSYAQLERQGFGDTPRPGVVRTDMESGPPKQATVESRSLHRISVVYLISTKADYQSFITWWETTISRVDWFDWTDPVSNTTKQARIVDGAIETTPLRSDLAHWEIRFDLEYWGT